MVREPTDDTRDEQQVSEGASTELSAMPVATAEVAPRQGDQLDGGVIARAQLHAVLQAGIASFLQRVRTEPHRDGQRFVGWKLISIFDDPAFALGPIRIGDVVLGVNGRTIERPEQFFAVWETLHQATELRFQVLRAGQAYEVRYAIAD